MIYQLRFYNRLRIIQRMLIAKRCFWIITCVLAGWVSASAQTQLYSWQHLPQVVRPHFKKDTFSIINYGAKADGITLNTKSINKAIAECSAKGGGVVLVPQGLWLTGPIVLKSNVNL